MSLEMSHVRTAEEHQKVLYIRGEQCLQELNRDNYTSDGNITCPRTWDGIMCWPPTPAGHLHEQQCAHYFLGFDHQANASKLCLQSGEWYKNNLNNTWTNYSQCYSEQVVTVSIDLDSINDNPLMMEYIQVLKTIVQVGYTISLITLVIAFFILATIKKLRCPRNMLHLHLFVSFIMRAFMTILKDMIFVSGLGISQEIVIKNGTSYLLDQNTWLCKTLTSVWQYSIMANYSWIFMEGLYLHNLIFLALFSDTSSITLYAVLGWGLPALFVLPWIIIRSLLEDTLCWTTNNINWIFWIIRGPIVVSIVVNFILFLIIVWVLLLKLRASVCEETRTYRRWAKSTLVLVPLFGVHYAVLLGMGMVTDPHVEIAWLFCDQIFASFQGFFVAVLYCFLNGEVRSELKRHWPRVGSLRVRGGTGRGFFSRPLRPARCYSSTSCTSLSMGTAGAGGCLSRKMRQSTDMGMNGSKRLSTSFVGPNSESRYSCAPNVRSDSEDNPEHTESLLSHSKI